MKQHHLISAVGDFREPLNASIVSDCKIEALMLYSSDNYGELPQISYNPALSQL